MLGKAAHARGQTCEPNFVISYQCGLVLRACCVKEQENSDFVRGDGVDPQDPGNSSPFQQPVSILQGVCICDTVGLSFLWVSHFWILLITG